MKDRIKAVRKAKGLTQQAMADDLGLKQNTIATYEMGRFQPSERTISDICRLYNVNETWLRTGEGEMFRPLDRDEEIAAYVGRLLGGKCTEFEQAIIRVMAKTTATEWELIAAKCQELIDECKNKTPGQD